MRYWKNDIHFARSFCWSSPYCMRWCWGTPIWSNMAFFLQNDDGNQNQKLEYHTSLKFILKRCRCIFWSSKTSFCSPSGYFIFDDKEVKNLKEWQHTICMFVNATRPVQAISITEQCCCAWRKQLLSSKTHPISLDLLLSYLKQWPKHLLPNGAESWWWIPG